VEGTAGNTGIGLALVANARGYRTWIVMPDTQSQEKKDTLRLAGVTLIESPALPFKNPNNYQHIARRLAQKLSETEPNGVLFADQWNNMDNRKAHYTTTGPEIWEQTDGKIDGFICAVGTGGTIAGVSTFGTCSGVVLGSAMGAGSSTGSGGGGVGTQFVCVKGAQNGSPTGSGHGQDDKQPFVCSTHRQLF